MREYLLDARDPGLGGRQLGLRLGYAAIQHSNHAHHARLLVRQRTNTGRILDPLELSLSSAELRAQLRDLLFKESPRAGRVVYGKALFQKGLDEPVQDISGKIGVLRFIGEGDDTGVLRGLDLGVLHDLADCLLPLAQRLCDAQIHHEPRGLRFDGVQCVPEGTQGSPRRRRVRRGGTGRRLCRVPPKRVRAEVVDHPFDNLPTFENLQLGLDFPVVRAIDIGNFAYRRGRVQAHILPPEPQQQSGFGAIGAGPQKRLQGNHAKQQDHEGCHLPLVAEENVQQVTK